MQILQLVYKNKVSVVITLLASIVNGPTLICIITTVSYLFKLPEPYPIQISATDIQEEQEPYW
jgi:hypothetical protein